MKTKTLVFLLSAVLSANSQTNPVISSWWINDDSTIVQNVLAGVHSVLYTSSDVYIKTAGIPEYYEAGHTVNDATGQNWIFKLPLDPQEQTGAKTAVPMGGQIGVLVDGSVIFGPLDAQTWNNGGVWHRIAYFFEGNDFDSTGGHSTPNNVYHHHIDPIILHTFNSGAHSPIIGFAFDGFPIYGPFGYANSDGTGGIKLMTPGYQLRNITDRQTLPDGSVNPGPAIGGQYPLGVFQEDYEFIANSGDLDEHNGKFTVTPEYPNGIYAYFATINAQLEPVYPYFIGPTYYGILSNGNTGPAGGNNSIPSNATEYIPGLTHVKNVEQKTDLRIFPNPAIDFILIENLDEKTTIKFFDALGKFHFQTDGSKMIDIGELPTGMYVGIVKTDHGFSRLRFQKFKP